MGALDRYGWNNPGNLGSHATKKSGRAISLSRQQAGAATALVSLRNTP